jgi:lysophospholipase L1-like esterase
MNLESNSKAKFAELFANLRAEWPDNRTIHLVFHGHSVPAGYHRTPEVKPFDSYPHMVFEGLKERFSTAVINCITTAIGGETSAEGARRFERDVLSHSPDLIFIDYALNDRRMELQEIEKSWREMIVMAMENQTPLVLLTPTGSEDAQLGDSNDPLSLRAALIRSLAREYHLPLADVSACWQKVVEAGTEQKKLLSQFNHPNHQGHSIAAREILRVLDAMRSSAEQE